jgi:hypothetical protein
MRVGFRWWLYWALCGMFSLASPPPAAALSQGEWVPTGGPFNVDSVIIAVAGSSNLFIGSRVVDDRLVGEISRYDPD